MEKKSNTKINKCNKIIFISCVVVLSILFIIPFITMKYYEFKSVKVFDYILYLILSITPFIIIGILGTKSLLKDNVDNKRLFLFWLLIGVSVISIIIFSVYKSGDYQYFLSIWCDSYAKLPINKAVASITSVSNYTPLYNYLLVLFSRTQFYNLFEIKLLTLAFSFVLAYVVTRIVAHIKQKKFNYILFVAVLALPFVLIEYSAWAQCDAIYTTFCLYAFYFALLKKSKLSFMMIGIAFAIKMQFLFIVPMLFVMLIIKDDEGRHYLRWRDMWIAPLMYVINLVPVLCGDSLFNTIMVYIRQTSYGTIMAGNCANLCMIYSLLNIETNQILTQGLIILHTIITITLMILLFIYLYKYTKTHKLNTRDIVFFGMVFAFMMVFFMPKMLDRFYYIAILLCLIWTCTSADRFSKSIFMLFLTAFQLTLANDMSMRCLVKPFEICSIIINIAVCVMLVVYLLKNYSIKVKTKE